MKYTSKVFENVIITFISSSYKEENDIVSSSLYKD